MTGGKWQLPLQGRTRAAASTALRVVIFVGFALWLAVPDVSRLRSFTVGDTGDAFFNLYVLEWGAHQLPHALRDYWAGSLFAGSHLTMAYSDTNLGIVPVFWALRLVMGPALAFNLIYVALWAIAGEATYRLAFRFTKHGVASFVAGLGYTFASIRIGQYGHWQLGFGALLPMVFLLAFRLFDERPRWWIGPCLGVAWAMMALSASYYGLITAVGLVLLVATALVRKRGRLERRTWFGLGAAAVLAVGLAGPISLKYIELQKDDWFRRPYHPAFAATFNDLRLVPPWNETLGTLPGLRTTDPEHTGENYAFPGVVVSAAALGGVFVLWRRRRSERAGVERGRRAEVATLTAIGVVTFFAAMGKHTDVFGVPLVPPLYTVFKAVVPGFKGIRALVRLTVVLQLALSVLAAVGLAALLRRIGRSLERREVLLQRAVPLLIGLVLAGVIAGEDQIVLVDARPPDATTGGAVNEALKALPAGNVAELPAVGSDDGAIWGLVEGPRMVLSTIDWHPRFGGYSGYVPPGYDGEVLTLKSFPEPEAMLLLERKQIRYVVLRTALVRTGLTGQDDAVAKSGFGFYSPDAAEAIVDAVPIDRLESVTRFPGAILLTLRSPAGG